MAEVLSWFSAAIWWPDPEAQQKPQGLRNFWIWNITWIFFFFFPKDEAADAGHMNILCQDFLFYTPCGYWLLNLPGVTGSVCYRNEQDRWSHIKLHSGACSIFDPETFGLVGIQCIRACVSIDVKCVCLEVGIKKKCEALKS